MHHHTNRVLSSFTALLALLLSVASASALTPERRLIAQDQGYFPVALRLADGRIAVVMRGGAPHLGIGGRLDIVFSSDEGQTWTKPTVVIDSPVDDRNPALGQSADGALVVAFWKNTRYDSRGQYNPNLKTAVTTCITRSEDAGRTWSEPETIDVSDIAWGSPFGRILTLPDHSMLMAIYGGPIRQPGEGVRSRLPARPEGGSAQSTPDPLPSAGDCSYVYRSTDNGKTWSRLSQIGGKGFNETALLRLKNGKLLAALRSDKPQDIWLATSEDSGRSWSSPARLTGPMTHPADLLQLPDGRTLLTCGYRVGPFGVRACLGDAEGKFDWSTSFAIAEDATNGDCGYPSSILLKDNRILTAYYAVASKLSPDWGTHCAAAIYAIPSAPASPQTRPTKPDAAALRTGDEGMWTLNNLPLAELQQKYNFVPTPQWLQHVQLSCVRIGDGGSGAFVSPNGLVLTNHHVALGQLQKMSRSGKDYVRDGFYAQSQSEEMRCPDLELNQLISMEDVTARITAAVDKTASDEDQNKQRKAEIARIEKESFQQSGLRSDVVELYQGGEYWLYRYRKYTDVRLVMAPEIQAAFYGGDFDNFSYPRFCLDFAFFRVYENGQPAKTDHYFKWSKSGPKDNELVFVAGHPGRTDRLRTIAQLEYDRDYAIPTRLDRWHKQLKSLRNYAARGPEQARQVQSRIFGVENAIKATVGRYNGLKDPAIFAQLTAREQELRKQVADHPYLAAAAGQSWDRIAAAIAKEKQRHRELTYTSLPGPTLTGIATQIVRYVVEVEKPNEKRYREYRDSALPSLELRLFSPAPIYPELEEHLLAEALTESRNALGADNKFVATALAGREPNEVAHDLITGTRLADPAFRRQLIQGGRAAVESSTDPLIQFARKLDPILREQRDWQENTIEPVITLEGAKIARARFAIYGHTTYPDATFTLRLAFGKVAGYEQLTTRIPWKTTFFGLLDRAASFDNQFPFNLSTRISQCRDRLKLDTPLDFVSTNDIIGGNSGSPVLNRNAEYVGLIFDGNQQGLAGDYIYADPAARAISVHSSAILEALNKIYDMPDLVHELVGE